MLKASTQSRNAKSSRNRHNGRINSAKQNVLDRGDPFRDSYGKVFTALVSRRWIQDLSAVMVDEDGISKLDPTKGQWSITSSIVRGSR
jgi:hypothetical protein